jgi:hypothetical protein
MTYKKQITARGDAVLEDRWGSALCCIIGKWNVGNNDSEAIKKTDFYFAQWSRVIHIIFFLPWKLLALLKTGL